MSLERRINSMDILEAQARMESLRAHRLATTAPNIGRVAEMLVSHSEVVKTATESNIDPETTRRVNIIPPEETQTA